ncbi:spore germination protein [Alkaliphilus sp. B6464]|uniref:spore germination protein n=1 Tax=Alkaliphilus sp. B6464 TaxID=2731219 RepID=UPI001BAA21A2|nr:spore germination protein [Alkaliphilus sp. B6464]QUH19234.1 spore germination protein [Alkaliphilus sp. B6464]
MSKLENYKLSSSLDKNIETIKEIFNNDDTLINRIFKNQHNPGLEYCIFFVNGMVDSRLINENIIEPIITNHIIEEGADSINQLHHQIIAADNVTKTKDIAKIIEGIVSGDTILFVEGSSESLIIDTKQYETRSIEEPVSEKVLRGPREGFTEHIITNLAMIRRKLKTNDLKFEFTVLGQQSRTRACICYIDGIVNKKILNELYKRLDSFSIDGVLDVNYIQEFIKDSPLSMFDTIGNTERPDVVAAKLLEGRIALILDGTPVVLTLPYLFIEYFQSNEDYYISFTFASIGRFLRVISFFITISTPAIYLALITFHQETIPTPLLLSIAAARQGVPFPTVVELLVLLIVFEILRESGIRMSTHMGESLSIVGALVLGQAAVEARFISAPIVIIVAITAITGFMIPGIKGASITLRFSFLLLSAMLGLYGYMFAASALLIHLFRLRSFGVPYMANLTSLHLQDLKDTAIRAPWWYMKYRPKFLTYKNIKREASGGIK